MPIHKFRDPRITNARLFGHGRPSAAPLIKSLDKVGFKIMRVHGPILAKLCYYGKQHFARPSDNTSGMTKKNINEVLAANLAYYMDDKELTQSALSKSSGVAQTTISLYLDPTRRQTGKSGKQPSAKLSEVELLADALGAEVWELLRPFSPQERKAYKLLEQAYKQMSGSREEHDEKSDHRKAG